MKYRYAFDKMTSEQLENWATNFIKNNGYVKQKKYAKSLRSTFINMYGGKCACCGETYYEFLALDHVDGLHGKVRESNQITYKKATTSYQPDIYRILCHNCNNAHGFFGYCPHKEPNKEPNYRKDKLAFLEMYGGCCKCCGESRYEFLTLEHKKRCSKW